MAVVPAHRVAAGAITYLGAFIWFSLLHSIIISDHCNTLRYVKDVICLYRPEAVLICSCTSKTFAVNVYGFPQLSVSAFLFLYYLKTVLPVCSLYKLYRYLTCDFCMVFHLLKSYKTSFIWMGMWVLTIDKQFARKEGSSPLSWKDKEVRDLKWRLVNVLLGKERC